jgi:hypothetical protein
MGFPSNSSAAEDNSGALAVDTVSYVAVQLDGKLINRYLAVVALAQMQTWETARGQIEYNLSHLRQGVRRILEAVET